MPFLTETNFTVFFVSFVASLERPREAKKKNRENSDDDARTTENAWNSG